MHLDRDNELSVLIDLHLVVQGQFLEEFTQFFEYQVSVVLLEYGFTGGLEVEYASFGELNQLTLENTFNDGNGSVEVQPSYS